MNALKLSTLSLLTASILALTACGGDKPAEQTAEPAKTETTQATTDTNSANPAATGEITIKTADGDKAIAANPTPIAVYDMTALQNLHALGVAVQGMPKDLPKIDGFKDANAQVSDIGTLFEPNLEAVHGLKPQAVFIGARMAEKKGELEGVAPVYNLTIDTNDAYAASKQQIADFGKVFGKETEATKLQADIDTAVADAKKAIEGKGNGLVILVNGGKMSAFGKNSRFGFLHTTFGVPMADQNIKDDNPHGQAVTFEYIQKTNPDWLFVLDRSAAVGQEGASAQSVLDNPLVRETKAWKNNQVVYLSPDSYLAFGGYYQWLKDSKIITDAVANAKPQS